MALRSQRSKTARKREVKPPKRDIVTPREPDGEELAEMLQMAEDSARRSMDKVRPSMDRAIRQALET
ncbi:MAG: hypothetical protein OYM47_19375 [Gemmatimonadota bacterium]|nr:hypothetical protein [Gemmatimonadota bacterium]